MNLSIRSAEALKYVALVAMTIDHVNKYLFNGTLPWAFEIGRIAMPIFAIVLASNLARYGRSSPGVRERTIARLFMWGAVAAVPYMILGGLLASVWPLNILFALAATAVIIHLFEKGGVVNYTLAALTFVISGSLVEFFWFGISIGIAAYFHERHQTPTSLLMLLLFIGGLAFVNGNHWALAAIPILMIAMATDIKAPRKGIIFYAYYPAHLAMLCLIRIPMAKAGYWFAT